MTLGASRLAITVLNPHGTGRGIVSARIDERDVATGHGPLALSLSGRAQKVVVVLGAVPAA